MVQAHLDADRHYIDDVRLLDHRWCERIWTPVATCAQQGREVFPFLLDSVQAHLGSASSSGRHHRGRYGGEVFPLLLDSVHAHLGSTSSSGRCKLIWTVQAHLVGASSSGRYSTAVAVAVRPLPASPAPCLSVVLRGPPRRPRERLQGDFSRFGPFSLLSSLHWIGDSPLRGAPRLPMLRGRGVRVVSLASRYFFRPPTPLVSLPISTVPPRIPALPYPA